MDWNFKRWWVIKCGQSLYRFFFNCDFLLCICQGRTYEKHRRIWFRRRYHWYAASLTLSDSGCSKRCELKHLRSFGYDKNYFRFQSGKKAQSGSETFAFETGKVCRVVLLWSYHDMYHIRYFSPYINKQRNSEDAHMTPILVARSCLCGFPFSTLVSSNFHPIILLLAIRSS